MNPRVGVIAIGRNEGARLERCLRSVVGRAGAVVYVDSGSKDGSVAFARSLGVEVVELDLTRPFTAARARNAGYERLLALRPQVELVQFVDGDCEVVVGWLETAAAALDGDARLGVVCGRRRERSPDASIYNRLCDMEWDTPVGEAKSCGGDAVFRRAAFEAAGRFNPGLIAGEEPELCVRLRAAGWTVRRLDAEMTLHDAAMTRFSQFWKRAKRAGHAYAEGAALHGDPPECHGVRQVRSIVFWGTTVPASIVICAVLPVAVAMVNVVPPAPPLPSAWVRVLTLACGASAALLLSGYLALAWRVYRQRLARGDRGHDAWLYARFTVLGKFANAAGVRMYRRNRRRGKAGALIEYKSAPRGAGGVPGGPGPEAVGVEGGS